MNEFIISSEKEIVALVIKQVLETKYTVREMGLPSKFLGWTLQYKPEGRIHAPPAALISKSLDTAGIRASNLRKRPLPQNRVFGADGSSKLLNNTEKIPYTALIGNLCYLANCTRLEFVFVATSLTQFIGRPRT